MCAIGVSEPCLEEVKIPQSNYDHEVPLKSSIGIFDLSSKRDPDRS